MPIRGEYIGTTPKENGNYIVFDLYTDEQWIAKIFQEGDKGPKKVLCGRDNSVHALKEHDKPNIRWIHITPLTKAEFDKYLVSP